MGEAPPTPPPTPAPGAGGAVRAREEERARARERQRQSEGEARRLAGRFAVLEAVAEVRAALREIRHMRGARVNCVADLARFFTRGGLSFDLYDQNRAEIDLFEGEIHPK